MQFRILKLAIYWLSKNVWKPIIGFLILTTFLIVVHLLALLAKYWQNNWPGRLINALCLPKNEIKGY